MLFTKELPTDEKYPESCVYWIYHEDLHDNPQTCGYIGVSVKGVKHRFEKHQRSADSGSTYHVHNAMRKYGSKLKVKLLLKADPEVCLLVEYLLRPVPEMAGTWNILAGGEKGNLGRALSAATREKMRNAQTPERLKLQSDKAKLIPAWKHGKADKSMWAVADKVYDCFAAHDTIGANLLGQAFGLEPYKLDSMCRKFASGWVPSKDVEWVSWSEGFTDKLVGCWKQGDNLLNYTASKPDWENNNTLKETWLDALFIKDMVDSGVGMTEMLKRMNLSHKRGSLVKIVKKLKAGWNPLTDTAYQTWLAEYKQKGSENVT